MAIEGRQSIWASVCSAAQWPAKPAVSGKPASPSPPSSSAALFQGMRSPMERSGHIVKVPACCWMALSPTAVVAMLMMRRMKRKSTAVQLRRPGVERAKMISPQSCRAA